MTSTLERTHLKPPEPDPAHRPKELREWESSGAGEFDPDLIARRIQQQWKEPGTHILEETVELVI
jgi:hypothetical protein